MTTRQSRFLKVLVTLGVSGIVIGAIGQGIVTVFEPSQTALPLPSGISRMAPTYRHDRDSLLAWKRAMYRQRVKPTVDHFLPLGLELPDLPK